MDNLLFVASKVLFFFVQPSTIAVLLVAGGLVLARRNPAQRRGWAAAWAGIGLMILCGLTPLANLVLLPLETRFARPSLENLGPVNGMIVLGGFEDTTGERGRGTGLNEAAERITEAARIARLMPRLKVVFSGGVGSLIRRDEPQAAAIGRWLVDMGIAPARITLEDRSRNTWENAVETRRRLGTAASGRWMLVTSAQHMPRAMGVFRKAGFDVVAWPVDYRTDGWASAAFPFDSIPGGLRRLDAGVKEWIGLVAYWLLGRTSALFPAP
jgi:uncharacterized SAM-binding protein YcdF (DUF218 family)